MKFYGNANLQQNLLQNAVLPLGSSWPTSPKVGELVFKDKILYICVAIEDYPVWVPLTNEIAMYVHNQVDSAAQWTVEHNLNTTSPSVQVWGNDNKMLLVNEVTATGANTVVIDLGVAQAGRAVVVAGSQEGNTKPAYAFVYNQTSPSDTWTVNHALGYTPIVRVFIGIEEVQPLTISHPSNTQTIITFSTPQVGVAKFI